MDGAFNSVSAKQVNVTRIDASEIVTERVNGTDINATLALKAPIVNPTFTSNVTVQGNLTVNGQIIQGGFSPVNFTNLAEKAALPIASVYPMGEDETSLYSTGGMYRRRAPVPTIKPYETTLSIPLRKSDGTPSNLLTSNTAWSNPVALDAYGNPAPLIKIENNGTFTYINVASNTITNICNSLLPASNTFDFIIYNKINSWTTPVSNNGTFYTVTNGDMADNMTQMVAGFAKRGFPLPGRQSVKGYNTNLVFYSDIFLPGESSYFASTIPNMGFDLNPFVNGQSAVTVYLLGGIQDKISLALPSTSIDWSNNLTLSGKTFPVTLSSVEYESKLASNLNVIYYDNQTSVMNFNLTDFGTYSFTSPGDGFNTSNTITSSPSFFRGSFGFYRKPVNVTTTPVLPRLGNSDVTIQERNFLGPVQSDIANAEFMIQTSAITVTYKLSNSPSSVTVNIPIQATVSGTVYLTSLTLPRYLGSSNVHCSVRLRALEYPSVSDDNEYRGFLLTNGSRVGDNENTPYITETASVSGNFGTTPASSRSYFSKNVGSLQYKADELKSVIPPIIIQSSESNGTTMIHEIAHNMQWSIGWSADDRKQDIFDDEWFAHTMCFLGYKNFFTTNQVGHNNPDRCVNHLTNGQYFPYLNVGRYDTTVFANVFSGTNFMVTNDVFNQSWNYILSTLTMNMISSYDPNGQLLKMFMYYASLKTKNLSSSDIFRLGYYNITKTLNPSIATSVFSNAIISANMHYSDGSSINNAGRLQHESTIGLINARNNTNIPPKYRCNYEPMWYKTSYSNVNIRPFCLLYDPLVVSTSFNQDSWDLIQTNEDNKAGSTVSDTIVPWYPKNITGVFPSGRDSWGRTYRIPDGAIAPYTQDCSFAAMANVSLSTFTSNVTRHLHSLQSFGYALSNAISNVTVELVEPTIGGSFGTYNSNISVSVFKYVPDRCVSNVTSTLGAYMMMGPFTLSSTGTTTKTIDLNALLVDGVGGATFSNTGSNVTASMASFNYIFPYGIDDETVYTPSAAAISRKSQLGMITGYYQPVTRILITNEYIDTSINFTDANILDKLYLPQIKPSAVKISIA
jgi:hypothetical protein